ncbi:MAG: ferritin-like domain-containing protein [Myxococcota bacterium]
MAIRYSDQAPQDVRYYPEPSDVASRMTPEHVEQVAEIFETPLQGAYNWDYEECDAKIKRLYELGKKLNWNAQVDIDWSQDFPHTQEPLDQGVNPFEGWEPFEAMGEDKKLEFAWHNFGWLLSQFMHGEQGALLVASQLVSCAPTYDAKLYAASQTFDEARHVEVFSRYLREKVRIMYPVNPNLKILLDKVLSDPRWDLKFIGMQIIIEGLALAAFHTFRLSARDPLFRQIIDYVIRDEARHVAFGVTYMEQFVKGLSQKEIDDRADFSYEANILMRERLIATEVHELFELPVEEARKRVLEHHIMEQFRNFLFTRIIPNLRKVGLLTDTVRPKYDHLGILQYENLVDDGHIDWATLEKGEVPAPMPA